MENYLLYTPRHVKLQKLNYRAGETHMGLLHKSLYSEAVIPLMQTSRVL